MRHSEELIEKTANRVRKELGLSQVLSPNMYCALEKLSEKSRGFTFSPELKSSMGDDEAVMDEKNRSLRACEYVLEGAKAGVPRYRFTIAHEIGHYFLGHTGERRRNPDKRVYQNVQERIEESEADVFANYFLVPTSLALDMQSADEISAAFQVSAKVAEIAFERVQREKRKASGQRRILPPSVIDFLAEREKRGR